MREGAVVMLVAVHRGRLIMSLIRMTGSSKLRTQQMFEDPRDDENGLAHNKLICVAPLG